MRFPHLLVLSICLFLGGLTGVPAQAKTQRPQSMEALVTPALKAVQKGDVKAYQRLSYAPSDGVRLCPKFAKTRGWEAGSPKLGGFDKHLRTRTREAIKSCASLGDWTRAELIHIKGGVTERRIPICEKSTAYRVQEVKALFRVGTTHVEVTLRHPGKINGAYGFMNPPVCRPVVGQDVSWLTVLAFGQPCNLNRARSTQGRPWRPSVDPADTNQIRSTHQICSADSKVAGMYGTVYSRFKPSFRTMTLESKVLGSGPAVDKRVITLSGNFLHVVYNDCMRCKGYNGWSFKGLVNRLPDSDLKELQSLIGIPANVPPLRSAQAWRAHYKK